MPWSTANPPKLPEHELAACPHADRPKSAKLAKFSDPVWSMDLPEWLMGPPGGLDPRIVCLLFSAAADEIETSLNAGHQSWSDVYDAIMRYPDQASLTKNTKDVEHSIDALVQRITLSRFPSFSALSPGQIRTAAGFANLDLPSYLVRYAAVTHVVATINEFLLKVASSEVTEVPLFYLTRSAVAEFDWGNDSYQISTIPATPMRESSSATAANARAHQMSIELAALKAAEPPKDSRSALADRTAQDARTAAQRLLDSAPAPGGAPPAPGDDRAEADRAAADRAAKRQRTEQGDSPFVFVSPDPVVRAASLRGPPGVNPLDSVSAYHDPAMISKLQSGVWPGVDNAFAIFTGSAAKPGNYTVTLDGNGGDMQFVSRASGASVPESPSDFSSVCKVIVANFATISPADADHIDRKLLGLILAYADMCDSDYILLGAIIDIELKAYVYHFARGTKDYPLPDATERVYNHARRVNRRNRERAARDVRDRSRRQPGTPDKEPKTPKSSVAFPSSGTATIGPRTKLVRTKAPGAPREDCKNHRLGIPCPQAYATGDCTRRHLGAFGSGRDDSNSNSASDSD